MASYASPGLAAVYAELDGKRLVIVRLIVIDGPRLALKGPDEILIGIGRTR
jgi:hypothetical protein